MCLRLPAHQHSTVSQYTGSTNTQPTRYCQQAVMNVFWDWKCIHHAISVIAHSIFGLHFCWSRWSCDLAFTHAPWITEKWIANRCTLGYPKFQNFLGGAFSQTPLQGLASHTAYYHQIFFGTLQPPHKRITPALYFAWIMLFTLLLPQQKFAPEPPVSKR